MKDNAEVIVYCYYVCHMIDNKRFTWVSEQVCKVQAQVSNTQSEPRHHFSKFKLASKER